jgi:predicted dehydrogenase
MKQINWGIIGCGDVTEVKSGPAFNMVKGSHLLAVMRRDAEKAKDYAKRHHVPFWFDSAEELIYHPEINAVYIATPPYAHTEYAIQSLNAGKITYVEKPMAMNYAECQRMIEASEKSGAPLFVAYYRRHLDYFKKIKELISSNRLGKVRSVSVVLFNSLNEDDRSKPWRVQPEISGGGYFADLGSHALDVLDYLLGPIKTAFGVTNNQAGLYDAEDNVCAAFSFDSGVTGTGLWCFSTSQKIDQMTIFGEKGMIEFSCFSFDSIIIKTAEGEESFDLKPPAHIQYQLIEAIVKEINGGEPALCDGVTASRTSRVMDCIYGRNL